MESYDYAKNISSLKKKDAATFLQLIQQARFEEHSSIGGEGIELRSNHPLFIAQGLFDQKHNSVIHFSAFMKEKEAQPERMIA